MKRLILSATTPVAIKESTMPQSILKTVLAEKTETKNHVSSSSVYQVMKSKIIRKREKSRNRSQHTKDVK